MNSSAISHGGIAFAEDLDELMMVQCQSSLSEYRIGIRINFLAFSHPLGENLRSFGETESEFSLRGCKSR